METTPEVEERLKTVEIRLDSLQRVLEERLPPQAGRAKDKRGWQALVGTFADDPLYDKAMRLGREWRDSQRDDAIPHAD